MIATSFIFDQNLTDSTQTGFLRCFGLLSIHASLGGFDFNVPLEHIEFLLGAMFLTSLNLSTGLSVLQKMKTRTEMVNFKTELTSPVHAQQHDQQIKPE
jgi:hypothetical protein